MPTEMLLGPGDVARISALGHDIEAVSAPSDDHPGLRVLKNVNGACSFLTSEGESYRCSIYEARPDGCGFYPMIYDVDDDTIVIDDEFCPHAGSFEVDPARAAAMRRYLEAIGVARAGRKGPRGSR